MRQRRVITVSAHYKLGLDQAALDFIDVDIAGDTRVYVDPRALRFLETDWTEECVALLQDYFSQLVSRIKAGDRTGARRMLAPLHEPNETHLGLSLGRARGSGLGRVFRGEVYEALAESEAVKSGLLEDLEDTVLLIEGIDRDRVSDIATNIIRGPLIRYTQEAAHEYSIPLHLDVESGPLWDPNAHDWFVDLVRLPVTPHGKLLLVPKAIVRRNLLLNASEYENDYIIPYLQDYELRAGSELVQTLKKGGRRVTKKDVRRKYGQGKGLIRTMTLQHPELLERYRRAKSRANVRPLTHEELAEFAQGTEPDWDALLAAVKAVPIGSAGATDYHRAAFALLKALFYPDLDFGRTEQEIHEGRKRIDIVFTNDATDGFFAWAARNYPAPKIMGECKNYTGDPGNPELDQLTGRFSPSRGQVGLLLCRRFKDAGAKARFLKRCRDTAQDQRGFVLTLDDDDLTGLVELRKTKERGRMQRLLHDRFEQLII